MKFVFLSRHAATQEQMELAAAQNIELVQASDVDAFNWDVAKFQDEYPDAVGVVCVHPIIALKAHHSGLYVGIFENANRAPEGEKPSFFAKSLVLWAPCGSVNN